MREVQLQLAKTEPLLVPRPCWTRQRWTRSEETCDAMRWLYKLRDIRLRRDGRW